MAFENLTFGRGGWLVYYDTDLDEPVRLRVGPRDNGRLVVMDLIVSDPAAVTGELLRVIPIGRIEAVANSPDIAAGILEAIDESDDDTDNALRDLLAKVTTTSVPPKRNRAPRLKLQVPAGGRKPDAFYSDVARAFSWLSRATSQPAVQLAEANSVPVTTAHRWVREARRRGLLPPARRQRPGGSG